jgi:hypothetical protein
MVSEDSQELGWLSLIHSLSDLSDLNEAFDAQMSSLLHQIDDCSELLEVNSFRGSQRMLPKERDDGIPQVITSLNVINAQMLTMVVVSTILVDLAALKECRKVAEYTLTRGALHNPKCRLHLPALSHNSVAEDGAAKATLTIHESHDPSGIEESFLLVFRTTHIVTAFHIPTVQMSCNSRMDDE